MSKHEKTTAAARAFGEAASKAAEAMRQFGAAFTKDPRAACRRGPLRLVDSKKERAK